MSQVLPDAALQQHIAVLGKTGSGKTFAAKAVIVEPLLERGRRVGIVDPTDAWWGLRSSRDGKGPGFPVLVLGGDHGDLPLPAAGGAAVARLLVEQNVNLVASTKHLTVGERTRWFIDFAGTISRLNRGPLHLVIDEAHNFAPQGKVPDPDTGRMLHAANTLASGGRSIGVRLTMITQRPQKLHKDTLTSADTLIAMRVLAPHDRQAVEDWIKGCGDISTGKEVLNSLAGLARGEGWVWYPEGGHLRRAKFPGIRTFDSSATPTDGHAVKAPKAAAEIDLTEINRALADAVKEAEENDPKRLRAELAKVRAQLKALESAPKASTITQDELNREYVRGREEGFEAGALKVRLDLDAIARCLRENRDGVNEVLAELERIRTVPPAVPQTPVNRPAPPRHPQPAAPARRAGSGPGEALPKAERALLIVLAQRHPKAASRAQLSILSGYSGTSSSFANALGGLRSKGYCQGLGDDNRITAAGVEALGEYEPMPTGQALVTWWLAKLGKAERTFLEYIAGKYPAAVSKEELAGETGYSITSSSFANALGKLRSLELIGRGEIRASEELFGG